MRDERKADDVVVPPEVGLEHSLGGGYGYVTFKFVTRLVQELHNVVSNVLDVRRDFPKATFGCI